MALASSLSLTSRVHGAVLGSFLGDATSLGYHWIYDTAKIPQHPNTPLLLEAPRAQWHSKDLKAGQFTHLGDQNFLVFQSVTSPSASSSKKFNYDLQGFWSSWKSFWKVDNPLSLTSYRDHATKATLASIEAGNDSPSSSGSNSAEFAPVGRIAPLLLAFQDDNDNTAYIQAVRETVAATHNTPLVLDTAEFFARLLFLIVKGGKGEAVEVEGEVTPLKAIHHLLSHYPSHLSEEVKSKVQQGLEKNDDTTSTIGKYGSSCALTGSLPSTIHLIGQYESDFKEALKRNIAAGGDNASRGAVVGAILGAYHGYESLPQDLIKQLHTYDTISKAIL
eukprot:TRINITY_DN799_c0_g1_i4.p1 TRINITY_DN799_c0_g1~~TRINITY_DN799_c0_g1_i4.p1  ORF type:complete len:334 (-),score=66.87 TRINITY_DN799_c0_g1_i4:86-1087(-)